MVLYQSRETQIWYYIIFAGAFRLRVDAIFMHCVQQCPLLQNIYTKTEQKLKKNLGKIISLKKRNVPWEYGSSHFGILLHQTLHTDEMARTNFSDWTKWKRVSRCLTNHEVIFVQVIYTTKSDSLGILNILGSISHIGKLYWCNFDEWGSFF